ncbi:hypothetical protein [Ulvibacter antarcticus]|uniref:hypothetical protein n=1 Tax=Ulvibacter antarcticus TaxID=442714 RepID=UPI001FE7C858|nr:hypothetical protein [Ulvibacter antarcticus]
MKGTNSIVVKTKRFFEEVGDMTYFAIRFFKEVFTAPFEWTITPPSAMLMLALLFRRNININNLIK